MGPDEPREDSHSPSTFPIVGIGASAGGLNAFECFLAAMPRDFGFALIFIQHLSPKHTSLMPGILRSSRPDLDIVELSDGLQVLPGKLYICPPAKEVTLHKSVFRVMDRPEDHQHLPVDELLVSLAEDAAEQSVAVILSGAGTDGARGVQAVRAAGGTIFVQDPSSAEFPGMPLAAIDTGDADDVLAPPDIAKEILKFYNSGSTTAASAALPSPAELEQIFRLINDKTGYRFQHYKKSVVIRRTRRRMYLHGIPLFSSYLEMLARKDNEAASLANDLMIGVTSFFRDRVAWKALHLEVTRKLAAQEDNSPIRVWTPACATGEEAYSIAMQLQNELELAGKTREIQIFATDINDRALDKAREGTYPASISADVPSDYMSRFFSLTDDGLSVSVNKEIRQNIIFAKQDILTDPPFSRLDLIICRNMLIYLEPDAQERCISIFHYALRNGGFLFLGNAESPGRKSNLFKSISHKKCRLYRKVESMQTTRLSLITPSDVLLAKPLQYPNASATGPQSLNQFVQEALLEEFSPAAVAIDSNYEIIYHSGPTNRFLRQPRGTPTQNLLELVPENLRTRLRGSVFKASREHKPVLIRTTMHDNDKVKLEVAIRVSELKDHFFLIIFREKIAQPAEAEAIPLETTAADEAAVRQLEIELSASRTELQNKIEQLKGLNEELQSSNEELQASNEELETSREELQSLNEEITTVNTQLQTKIEEQEETNNDLNNFLTSTSIPTVFLDEQLRVKRFTPAMTRLIKLIPADIGRPIMDMSQESLGPDLISDAEAVLDRLVPVNKEINVGGAWYVRSTLPYRTADSRIEGVVITYSDVSELKMAKKKTEHLASFPELNPNPVLETDLSGNVIFSNPATHRVLEAAGLDKGNISAILPADLEDVLGNWDRKNELILYREISIGNRIFGETVHLSMLFNGAHIYAYDITQLRSAQANLLRAKEEWERTFASVPDMIALLDTDHKILRVNEAMANSLGRTPGECIGMHCYELVHGMSEPPAFCPHVQTLKDGKEHIEEVHEVRMGRDLLISTTPLKDADGRMVGSVHVAHDISGRKRAEYEREMAVEFLSLVNASRNTMDLVHAATEFFQNKSGCAAVGIRLRNEHDYPYYETRGFAKEFVLRENRLCARDKDGRPVLDVSGNPVLDCMCGNVISGRFDPSKPFFTNRGNFWTNNTTRLLANTTEKDRKTRTRNRCNGEGYESVALIGLTLGDERIGLLQLNDKRPDRFTPESIALWERLADYLAVALAKFRSDEALRERQKQLSLFVEHAPAALAMFDREMRYLSVSRRWLSDYGLGERDILGHSHYEIFPEMPERWKEIHRRALAGEIVREDDDRFERADGSVQWLSWEVRPWYNDAGEVAGIVVFSEDITERKRGEEIRGQLSAIVESADDAIISKDLNGNILTWNKGAEQIFGYGAEEAIGRNVSFLVPPGHDDEVPGIIQKIIQGEHIERFETVRLRKDVTIIPVSLTFSSIRDAGGKIIGVSKIAHDISERKKIEEETLRLLTVIQQERDRLDSLISNISDEVWFADTQKHLVLANPSALRTFGVTDLSALNVENFANSLEVYRADGTPRPANEAPPLRALEGEVVVGEEEMIRIPSNGELRYREVNAAPVRDAGGAIIGSVSVVRDITERKRAEEALQESEQRVRHKLESILSPEGDIGNLELADIIDLPAIESLMEKFHDLIRIPLAVIDLKGKVLIGRGWQEICTKFHRVQPETCIHCMESDTKLTAEVLAGEYKLYKCMNNMWDVATPIEVGGKQLGHFFTGQFFFDDESPDYEFFRAQAKRYGFDESDYLAALDKVPRLNRETVDTVMRYFMKFSGIISQLSYSNIKLARLLYERDALMSSLRESEERLKRAQEIAHLGGWELDLLKNELTWSDEVYRIFGLRPQEFEATYEAFLDSVHPDDRAEVDAAYSGSLREGRDSYEIEHRVVRKSDGKVRVVHEKCEHFRDEAGSIIRSVGMVHDITGRKEAEDQLRRTMEELRAKNEELERFNRAAVGRELRMIELKKEINLLCESANLPARYKLTSEKDSEPTGPDQ